MLLKMSNDFMSSFTLKSGIAWEMVLQQMGCGSKMSRWHGCVIRGIRCAGWQKPILKHRLNRWWCPGTD